MKKTKLIAIACISLLVFVAACHKNNPNPPGNNGNSSNNATLPSDANGGLYSIINVVVSDDGSGTGTMDTESIYTGMAWFDSYTQTKDAGNVNSNGADLDLSISGIMLPWYQSSTNTPDYSTGDAVQWVVDGNTTTGIPAINHTDNTLFPKVTNFSLASMISLNSSLTVHFNIVNSNDAVIATLAGDITKLNKNLAANATSVTFTSAELKQVAVSGGSLAVQIMPVKVSPALTVSGKKYYFVKQYAYALGSMAM